MNHETQQAQLFHVSAIVPAYNEEKTIAGVIDALLQSPAVGEIFAVDDGSTDRTAGILSAYQGIQRVQIILLAHNQGKGHAMTTAAQQATGEILLCVDADLRNLTPAHVERLLEPMQAGQVDMVVGVPIRSTRIRLAEWLDPCRPLSGQRAVYRQDFLQLSETIQTSGYGVETILNLHYRQHNKRVRRLYLPNLHHPIKVEKTDLASALPEYLREGRQILDVAMRNPHLVWGALRSALAGREL